MRAKEHPVRAPHIHITHTLFQFINKTPLTLPQKQGTPIAYWAPPPAFAACNRTNTVWKNHTLYNAMIAPFAQGPTALAGFVWYQGEADTQNQTTADAYACLFPAMIESWRTAFSLSPATFFGFIQLSTWGSAGIPEMRQAQMAALQLPGVAYAVNADHGAGRNVHPPAKQFCAKRLADAALELQYNVPRGGWKSPSYASAKQGSPLGVVSIQLADVTSGGLHFAAGAAALQAGPCRIVDAPGCGIGLQFNDANSTWVGALVNISADGQGMVLTALPPPGASGVLRSCYGWAGIPTMTVYRADKDLPVRAWNESIAAE